MRTVFTGGRVFDGTGVAPATADLVIEDGRIVDVGSGLDGDTSLDVTGKTLLPGLFDTHVHVAIASDELDDMTAIFSPFSRHFMTVPATLRRLLELGITTIRDAAGADLGIKVAVEEGLIPGPRMQISVNALSATGGHSDGNLPSGARLPYFLEYPGMPDPLVDGPEDARRVVRTMIRAGADVIKISSSGGVISQTDDPRHPTFDREELEMIVATAADLGRWVMCHAHGAEGIKRAVRAGVRSIEHGTFLDEEGAALMLERGTWLVPTLLAGEGTQRMLEMPGTSEIIKDKIRAMGDPVRASFRMAVEAGVRIALGTDCPVNPHGTNLRELELMVRGGITPAQALVAATSSAAELMGLGDELGTLSPGKRADVVVVDGDPYDVATLADRIDGVWKDGVRVVPFA